METVVIALEELAHYAEIEDWNIRRRVLFAFYNYAVILVNGRQCYEKEKETSYRHQHDIIRAADEAIAVYDDPVVRSMDGYEAAGRIRQYEKKLKRKHLPIIALTANVFAEDSERALRAGMDAHMGKPVEVPQLLATMMHWIG